MLNNNNSNSNLCHSIGKKCFRNGWSYTDNFLNIESVYRKTEGIQLKTDPYHIN